MQDEKLQYFILQKAHPHFKGIITDVPLDKIVPSIPVSGYNLYINFDGCLRGNVIPSYKGIEGEIASVLNDMSIWFYEQRILFNPKKYKKWKV